MSKSAMVVRAAGYVAEYASGEYLLERADVANGGTVVFVRAAHVSSILLILALAAINMLDPTRRWKFEGRPTVPGRETGITLGRVDANLTEGAGPSVCNTSDSRQGLELTGRELHAAS
jgi:hypothetical protein